MVLHEIERGEASQVDCDAINASSAQPNDRPEAALDEAASGASLVRTTHALSRASPAKARLDTTNHFSPVREGAFGFGLSTEGCFGVLAFGGTGLLWWNPLVIVPDPFSEEERTESPSSHSARA